MFRRGDQYHAFSDACPHMGTSLADGRLVGNFVQCHWHGWKYDLDTGKSDVREWACIEIYPTRIEGDELWVELPEPVDPQAPLGAAAEGESEEEWFKWDPDSNRKIEE